ncbi:MAG: pyridoxamine 5'-phosphate oxidase family protein [Lautropia sp.]
MKVSLDQIRDALEGANPAVVATCSADGVPNVAMLSQVHYIDERHVALSYQFFSKTRRNILDNPYAQLTVPHPRSARLYRMTLHYLRTEKSGPLFERMKAHLEGIASHTGMAGVFRLLGSDIYEVLDVEATPGRVLPLPPPPCNPLAGLRRACDAIARCTDVGTLVDATLDALTTEIGSRHAAFLVHDEAAGRLYTVGSRGYEASGVGSEIAVGDGVLGVCVQARTVIRISWLTHAYRYSRTIREVTLADGAGNVLSTEIPYPGLADPHSQVGAPLIHAGRVLGALFVESEEDMAFGYDHEDALVALAGLVAASLRALGSMPESAQEASTESSPTSDARPRADAAPAAGGGPAAAPAGIPCAGPSDGRPVRVRCYAGTNSIFVDDAYIIKGVAGAVLWRLLSEHAQTGRTEFTNREIRLDPSIRLPDIVDNLEARLILLRRRLAEQACGIALEKAGRGRLRLCVASRLELALVEDRLDGTGRDTG